MPDGPSADGSPAQLAASSVGIGGGARPVSVDSNISGLGPRTGFSQLSVRSDWDSEEVSGEMSSPSKGMPGIPGISEGEEGLGAITEGYASSLRSGRHTLTRTHSFGKAICYGVHSIQNLRPEMEDAHRAVLAGIEGASAAGGSGPSQPSAPSVSASTAPSSEVCAGGGLASGHSFFAVFDGHGGARAAEFCAENLFSLLSGDPAGLQGDSTAALRRAFARCESEWLAAAKEQELMDGTTAAVALVDRASSEMLVGNVGDSEVILCTRETSSLDKPCEFQVLTEVHHLKRSPQEMERVNAMGGRVWRGRLGHSKISPQVLSLSVSRAIGDLFFKDEKYTGEQATGLIAEPHIMRVQLPQTPDKEAALVIGCDGLWDAVTYREAADFVFERLREGLDAQGVSEALVRKARDAGSSDNITVMVVLL